MRNRSNYKILMNELKQILRLKKIRYSALATELRMSESSVKRIMSGEDASLSKIEEICEVAGISFFELVDMCKEEKLSLYELTKSQEDFFTREPEYFEFLMLIYESGKSVEEVQEEFKLTDYSTMMYLKKLEELRILERYEENKIKFLISGSISIGEIKGLGQYLTNRTLDGLKEFITGIGSAHEGGNSRKGNMQMSENFLKPETAQAFMKEQEDWSERIIRASSREEKIYGKSELVSYSTIQVCLPVRLYKEQIKNIEK